MSPLFNEAMDLYAEEALDQTPGHTEQMDAFGFALIAADIESSDGLTRYQEA